MKVRATKLGYHGLIRRKIGDVFELKTVKGKDRFGKDVTYTEEQQFSKNWMERVESNKPSADTKQDQAPKFTANQQIVNEEQGNESDVI